MDNTPQNRDNLHDRIDQHDRTEEFIELLTKHQRQIYVYTMTLVPTSGDVDDIMQETSLVLWREFDQFQSGTNFKAWACRIAFNQVLAWRKRRQRDRLRFSEEFLRAVAEEADTMANTLDHRSEMLKACTERLPDHHQKLIRLRYHDHCGIDTIARQVNRSIDAVYRLLSRIRHNLHECVSLKLRREWSEK